MFEAPQKQSGMYSPQRSAGSPILDERFYYKTQNFGVFETRFSCGVASVNGLRLQVSHRVCYTQRHAQLGARAHEAP